MLRSVIYDELHWSLFCLSDLNGIKDGVVDVGEARVMVHHAVYKLSKLQQESFTAG